MVVATAAVEVVAIHSMVKHTTATVTVTTTAATAKVIVTATPLPLRQPLLRHLLHQRPALPQQRTRLTTPLNTRNTCSTTAAQQLVLIRTRRMEGMKRTCECTSNGWQANHSKLPLPQVHLHLPLLLHQAMRRLPHRLLPRLLPLPHQEDPQAPLVGCTARNLHLRGSREGNKQRKGDYLLLGMGGGGPSAIVNMPR